MRPDVTPDRCTPPGTIGYDASHASDQAQIRALTAALVLLERTCSELQAERDEARAHLAKVIRDLNALEGHDAHRD